MLPPGGQTAVPAPGTLEVVALPDPHLSVRVRLDIQRSQKALRSSFAYHIVFCLLEVTHPPNVHQGTGFRVGNKPGKDKNKNIPYCSPILINLPEAVACRALAMFVATEGSTLEEVFPLVAGLAGDEGGGQGGRAEVNVPLKQHGLTLSSLKEEQKQRRENMNDHAGPTQFL